MKHIWIQRDLAIKHDNLAIKHVDCKHQTSYKIACQPGKVIANLRYPAKNDKFFAGERRYSH